MRGNIKRGPMAENVTDFDGVPWQLIDALPAAIYVTDTAGRITYFNEAAAALWDHRPRCTVINGAVLGGYTG